jgi:hypothetical protein
MTSSDGWEECVGRLRSARTRLGTVREHLLEPDDEVWGRCEPGLRSAVDALASVEHKVRTEPMALDLQAEVREELVSLRQEVVRVNRLMNATASFYNGWARLLAGGTDYSAQGAALALPARARLSVCG